MVVTEFEKVWRLLLWTRLVYADTGIELRDLGATAVAYGSGKRSLWVSKSGLVLVLTK